MKITVCLLAIMTAFVQSAPALETSTPGSMPASYYQRKNEIAKEAQSRRDEQAKRDAETKKWVEQMQAANAKEAAAAARKAAAARINQPAILVVGPTDPGFEPDVLYAEPIKPQVSPIVDREPVGRPESPPNVSRIEDSRRSPAATDSGQSSQSKSSASVN